MLPEPDPPPPPHAPSVANTHMIASRAQAATHLGRRRAKVSMTRARATSRSTENAMGGTGKRSGAEGAADRPSVVTVNVVLEAKPPADPAGMDAGLNEPVAPVGRPETEKVVTDGSPTPEGIGLKLRPKLACPPAVTVVEPPAGAMEKSTQMPIRLKATVGNGLVLLVTLNAPLNETPVVAG